MAQRALRGLWKRDGVYYLNYRNRNTGRRVRKSLGVTNAQVAQDLAEKERARLRDGGLSTETTLDEFIPRVLAEHYAGKVYRADAERYLNRFREFAGGQRRLAEVTKGLLSEYVKHRMAQKVPSPYHGDWKGSEQAKEWEARNQKTVSPSTVNRDISVIKCMMNRAVEWNVLPLSPLAGLRKSSEKKFRRTRFLSRTELRVFLPVARSLESESARDIILLALYTGRRQGDLLRLRLTDYDQGNGLLYLGVTKKGAPEWIPLPPQAKRILDERVRTADCAWLFPNKDKTGHLQYIQSSWETLMATTGIQNFKFHDLRHTCISYMVMAGINFFVIASLVGHTTPMMLQEVYGHLSPEHKKAVVQTFSTYLAQATGEALELTADADYAQAIVPKGENLLGLDGVEGGESQGPVAKLIDSPETEVALAVQAVVASPATP